EFDNKGNFVQQWSDPNGSPSAIAVDATNDAVYLITFGTTARFPLTGGSGTTIDSASATALALNPETGDLYVDHGNNVVVYNSAGPRIDTLFSLGTATNSQGLAYLVRGRVKNAGRGDSLYVSDRVNNEVTIYGPRGVGAPFITDESTQGAGKNGKVLTASIVPLGSNTTCVFQYVNAADFAMSGYANATTGPCTPASLGASFTYQQASATIGRRTVGDFY